jgi:AcrR family transcriptional regulator
MSNRTGLPSKRRDILLAAKQLLWEKGYEATSPRDIMARSSAGQGSLYHHFPTKLELARSALAEMASEEIAKMDDIFDPAQPPLERVRRYLLRERDALRGCRLARLANESAVEIPEFRAPISNFLGEIQRRLEDSLTEAIRAKQFSGKVDPSAIAAALVALVEGGFILARTHWNPSRMELAIDGGMQLLTQLAADPKLFKRRRPKPAGKAKPKR